MAFDGIVISNVVHELRETILDGRINKIAQPEKDELVLTIKGQHRTQYKLLLSAGAGLPLIYLTEESKTSPLTAPNFCMLLRKHLNNAKILDITQPGMERVVNFKLEHVDEMGDLGIKYLIIELMGKHSNIIFCSEDMKIIDSIKRINMFVSSVREVLPGRDYFIPETMEKYNPLEVDFTLFQTSIMSKALPVSKALYTSLTGISPLIANEVCYRASIDGDTTATSLEETHLLHLYRNLEQLLEDVKQAAYHPNIIVKDGAPVEFSSLSLTSFQAYETEDYNSVSKMLEAYYASKNSVTRIRQKSADLRKIVSNAIDRAAKKYDLQAKQLKDTDKRDKYKVYGELITAYGYGLEPEAKVLNALNYYTNEDIQIPLDPTMTPMENAKHYFDKYSKLKRTFEALTTLLKDTSEELSHLKSIQTALDIAVSEDDLMEIRQELVEHNYMKRKAIDKQKPGKKANTAKFKSKSKPFHYLSSDGYHIYVGKNNFQNEDLTFQVADGGDWWFHAKNTPGSHVIIKSLGHELPDRTFEEAGRLAAHYSSARGSSKVEIDYIQRKHVKKPSAAKPGFVIYNTNYSLITDSDITGIQLISS